MQSLHDGWEMIGWLAPPNSKYVGCDCKSPRDGWEMAGWLALAISKDFMCNFGSLGDGWEMAGRTPLVLEHPIQTTTSIQLKTIQHTQKPNQLAGCLVVAI